MMHVLFACEQTDASTDTTTGTDAIGRTDAGANTSANTATNTTARDALSGKYSAPTDSHRTRSATLIRLFDESEISRGLNRYER